MRGWNCIKSFCILKSSEHGRSVAVRCKIKDTDSSEKRQPSVQEVGRVEQRSDDRKYARLLRRQTRIGSEEQCTNSAFDTTGLCTAFHTSRTRSM